MRATYYTISFATWSLINIWGMRIPSNSSTTRNFAKPWKSCIKKSCCSSRSGPSSFLVIVSIRCIECVNVSLIFGPFLHSLGVCLDLCNARQLLKLSSRCDHVVPDAAKEGRRGEAGARHNWEVMAPALPDVFLTKCSRFMYYNNLQHTTTIRTGKSSGASHSW